METLTTEEYLRRYVHAGRLKAGIIRNPKQRNDTPLEKDEQKAVVAYLRAKNIPVIASLNGVVVGGQNRFAAINSLKAQGMEPGCPDLFIPVPRNGYHGMFIELKRVKGSVTSDEQLVMIGRLCGLGYHVVVAKGSQQAIDYINSYMA